MRLNRINYCSQGAILIHEVYPDGAANKDGRLKPGDQILEVNGESFRNITHSRALAVLRQTPAKVRIMVYRDETSLKDDDMLDIIEVELLKKPGRGLGLSIVGRRNGPGVYISDVVRFRILLSPRKISLILCLFR